MFKSRYKILFSFIIIAAGVFVSYAIAAYAQDASLTTPTSGISFPIPDLGNCSSKENCRVYCSDSAHIDACVSFAKTHGLMNKDEATRAVKFKDQLLSGSAPGGCKSADECKQFCGSVSNIDTCTAFAKKQGFTGAHLDAAEKIAAYIKSGGKTPGSCAAKDECENYCKDFSHADECYAFAKAAGLTSNKQGIPEGQFQKFLELAKNNETPGACKSKDDCEKYCRDSAHFGECISFAKKAGFISDDQVQKLESAGGKGPGGCASAENCKQYCGDSNHREECFKFAEDHGFIGKDDVNQIKDGLVRLKQGLQNAPPEVTACINSVIGSNTVDNIQAGGFVPGSEMTGKIKDCFQKFGQAVNPTALFKKAPPGVFNCLKEKLGDKFNEITSDRSMPTPEMADVFRACSQKNELERPKEEYFNQSFNNFLRGNPPAITECLKKTLGADFDKLQSSGTMPTSDIKDKVKDCFNNFKPQQIPSKVDEQIKPTPFAYDIPPQILECLKNIVGADVLDRLQQGKTEGLGEAMRSCYGKFTSGSNPKPPTQDSGQICVQVITPAKNQITGECKQFSTPCEVPVGWLRVPACEGSGSNIPQVQTQMPQSSVCFDEDSCAKNCGNSSSPYYNSPECQKFNSTTDDFGGNFLKALNIFLRR
ncbi:MAG: hypothetical protein AAB432_02525 [Patescibacteria group bacterium]